MSALTQMPKVLEVLRWYAERENHYPLPHGSDGWSAVNDDCGERARALLAELEKEGIK